MNFIEDKELENLNEFDLLDTKKYANTLENIVEKSKTPLTIGIFGEWGSGKSSIINTVKNNIDENKIKFIIYDAWKYQGDSFRRMFLRELANQLDIKMQDNFESFYIDKNENTEVTKGINWAFFGILTVSVLILLELDIFKDVKQETILVFIATIIGIIGKDIFDKYSITINRLKLFAPEQFEEIYNEIIDTIFKQDFNPIKWVKKILNKDIEKIVIVIDNLDRCDDNAIYELLTTIKTFLQKENVIFIIPIDDLRLKKFLSKNHNLDEKEVDEFLRKIFDVTLKIKQFKPLDIFHYTNQLNQKYNLHLQPDTVDIFAKEYATNPRRIIQVINNLLVEKNILKTKYDEKFVEQYESIIAKLLIIREEWPDFYKKLQENPKLINQFDNINNDEKYNQELKKFLKRTKGYTANIDSEIIDKIISNIDNDFGVDNSVIEKIKNFEYEQIREEQIDEKLLNYIFEELQKEIKNKTFKGGALNRFKNLIKLNSIKELPLNFINRFNSDFDIGDILKIVDNLETDEFDDLFIFLNLLNENHFNSLLNTIINKYNEIWKKDYQSEEIEKLPKIWNDGLNYLINNIDDEKKIKLLQEAFIYFYDYYSESPLYEKKWIEEDKLKIIISQKFIDYLIDRVDESFENNAFKELVYFGKLGLLNIQQIEKIFEKFNWTNENNFANQQEAKERCLSDLITKINNLNNLIELLKPIQYQSQIIENKLQQIQSTSKKYKQGYQNYSVNINLLNDINYDEEKQKNLLEFYLNIYKDTYNKTDTTAYIKNLVNKYQNLEDIFYSNLLKLNKKYNFKLTSLLDYLMSKNSLNEDLLKIYLVCIKDDKTLNNYKEKLKNKIVQLLKQYDNHIKWFFDEIIQKDIFKEALIDILTEDFENFNKLPLEYKKIVFDYICGNNLVKEYENNLEVLRELAKEKFENCIENILVKKLGDEKIGEVLDVLESFKTISKTLWKNLGLLQKYKNEDEWKEKIENIEQKLEK